MPFPLVMDKYGGYIDHTNWENIAVSNLISLEARIKIPLFSIRACLITNKSTKAAEECFGSTITCFSTKMCLWAPVLSMPLPFTRRKKRNPIVKK